jgi:hypothetical protein
MTHGQFRLAAMQNLIEKAGSLRCSCWLMGRPLVLEEQATRLEGNFSNHWPVRSYRLYCHVCSARGIKRRVQVKCKDCDAGICIGVSKPTTPNPRHDVVFRGTGNPRTFSPNRYVEEIYFACFLQGNQEQCQGDQLMACQAACKYN